MSCQEHVGEVFRSLVRDPWGQLLSRWNWKSALTSALIRAAIFFFTNLRAGAAAASAAWLTEFVWRFALSGYYGALIQRFRFAIPQRAANAIIAVGLPVFNHTLEFLIHSARGTPELKRSMIVSVCFTVISMLFNAYAMRRGVMITGAGAQSLTHDLRQMPGIILGFVLWLIRVRT
jgi:hypothetical protein